MKGGRGGSLGRSFREVPSERMTISWGGMGRGDEVVCEYEYGLECRWSELWPNMGGGRGTGSGEKGGTMGVDEGDEGI